MNQSQEAEIAARRIVVLAGGPSAERMISLQSGRAVVCALQSRDRRVVEVDPAVTDLETFD
ncbi:MAG: D-alanine--D-alanine ligase, partial [Planctomycetota bacterium]